jgi:hypothetical protein
VTTNTFLDKSNSFAWITKYDSISGRYLSNLVISLLLGKKTDYYIMYFFAYLQELLQKIYLDITALVIRNKKDEDMINKAVILITYFD